MAKAQKTKKKKSSWFDFGQKSRTAQETIPYKAVFEDGIFMITDTFFSKSYFFDEANFDTENEELQEELLKRFGKLLNKFGADMTVQFSIFNRKTSQQEVEDRFFIHARNDNLTEFRDEYNGIITEEIKKGRNDIRKERYITIGIENTDIIMARKTFGMLDMEINEAIRGINKIGARPIGIEERITILHDIFRSDESNFAAVLAKYHDQDGNLSLKKMNARGVSTKDLIATPLTNGAAQIKIGENLFAKSFIINDLPASIDTKFLSDITSIPCQMLTSVIHKSLPRKEAIRMAKRQANAIKSKVAEANQQAYEKNYDSSLLPEGLLNAREESQLLVKDITIHNQKMLFSTISITIFANSINDLKDFETALSIRVSDYSCQLTPLLGQQMLGLKNALPLGKNYLSIDRQLTTESACAFLPFSVQELMDKNGYFYGLNAITKNMILYNRRDSDLPNGMIFGKSGSGKSYITKGEIIPVLLDTDDDVIILDPDGEYAEIANQFGGTVFDLYRGAENHVNPLDMDINYAAEDNADPIDAKADYIVSLCESVMGKRDPITPYDINVIYKCCKKMYADYMRHMEDLRSAGHKITCDTDASPTLVTFHNTLLSMDTPEAHRLAAAMESVCVGKDDIFAHRTNVKGRPRFVVYNLKRMPKTIKEFAMKVCLSDIWNRVVQNLEEGHKATWVYLDEFYLLVQTESSATILQEYYKRIRKYHGIMTAITQDIEDVLITPQGRAILNNSGFIIMMNQSPIGRTELQAQFNISPTLIEYIKDKPPGIGLVYNGKSIIPFDYKLPTNTKLHKIMSTKPTDR